MKRTITLVMALMMIAMLACAVIPAGAETADITAGPLLITEIHNNPDGVYEGNSRDYTEYMEIMNVGDTALDLYEYKFWYTSGGSLADCPYPDPLTNKWNVFASAPGVNVLEPGEIAVIWFVTGESILPSDDADKPTPTTVDYFRKEITEAEKANYEYTLTDYEGKVYAYNVAEFKRAVKAKCESIGNPLAPAFDNVKLIVCDINIDLEKPADEDIASGRVGVTVHFNMANCSATKAVKYWVVDKDVTTFDENTEYICTAGVSNGAKWAGQSFHYTPVAGSAELIYAFDSPYQTPGYLFDAMQPELVNLRHAIDPEKYPDTVEIVTTTEKQEDEVTTEEETNPPKTDDPTVTTKAPVTTTKKPDTTTASPTDNDADNGGCGGFTVAAQLIALLSAAVVFVAVKKK